MATSHSSGLFERVPNWWSESVLGLAVAFAGVAGMALGSAAVGRVAELLAGPADPSSPSFESMLPYALTLLLLAVVSGAVGFGVAYAYLAYREFDPGFAVEWPDPEAGRWLVGLVVLAPALVLGTTLLRGLLGYTGPDGAWTVTGAYVAPTLLVTGLDLLNVPLLVSGLFSIAVLAGVVGPAVAALFHGVLQNSLRRVAPTAVAVGGTALAAGALANDSGLAGAAVVAAVVAAAGYGYDRTGNLAVPMAAYAALNAVTLTTALLFVLSAAGAV